MKLSILLFTCLYSSLTLAKIGKVPSSWIHPSLTEAQTGQKSLSSFASTNQLEQLDEAYKNILDTKMDLFETIPDDSHKRWYLQSILTGIAIEAGGTIGLMGVGGSAALELIWTKDANNGSKNNVMAPVALNEITDPIADNVTITTEMTKESIMKELAPVMKLTMATGHIASRESFSTNLLKEALAFQKTVKEIEASPALGPWYAYKYQLEIFVSAEGKITYIDIGGSVRIRMEWWRIQKPKTNVVTPPFVAQKLSHNAKFIAAVASDLSVLDEVPFDNGFKLNAMKVGVGTAVTGNLFFVKAHAEAIGAVFFKRDEIKSPAILALPFMVEEVSTYTMSDAGGKKEIPRYNFRNGLKKSANITHFFATNAKTKKQGAFNLNVIETEFIIHAGGDIGIVTVEGNSVLTLFVTRNVTI